MKDHHPCHSEEQVNVIVHFPRSTSTSNSAPCMSQGQLKMSRLREKVSHWNFANIVTWQKSSGRKSSAISRFWQIWSDTDVSEIRQSHWPMWYVDVSQSNNALRMRGWSGFTRSFLIEVWICSLMSWTATDYWSWSWSNT